MSEITLKAELRTEMGRQVRALRRAGWLPVVLYGHNVEPMNLKVKYLAFEKLYTTAGENTIVTLDVDGKSYNVLIQDPSMDPVTSRFTHADLFALRMDEKIEAEVNLEVVGVSSAVKDQGGILIKNLTSLQVRCLPKDLIHKLEVNIGTLSKYDDAILVKDLAIPSTLEVLTPVDEVIVTVDEPRSEAELKELETEVTENVEAVEGVKKEEPAAEGDAAKEGDAAPAAKEDKK